MMSGWLDKLKDCCTREIAGVIIQEQIKSVTTELTAAPVP